MIFVGVAAFALLLAGDANDAFRGEKRLRFLFPLGSLLLAAALIAEIVPFLIHTSVTIPRVLCWALTLLCAAGLVYALFFALPAEASYAEPGQDRAVCGTGLYALCRHPGVVFFALMMLFLRLGAGLSSVSAVVYIILNILLSAFEDAVVFPRRLKGYAAYRAATPFLIPTPRSIRAAFSGRR